MRVKLLSQQQVAASVAVMNRLAADIGHVAIAWNSLHDTLGEVFAEVLGSDRRSVVMAAWQAVNSDRSKREMLLHASARRAHEGEKMERLAAEIKWACGRMNSLEDNRNDTVHSPFSVSMDSGVLKVVPVLWTGSHRAAKFEGKDLKFELQTYTDHIRSLTIFARGLIGFSVVAKPTWPERPPLRRPDPTTARKSRSRQTGRGQSPRQPRSSPE